MKLHNLPERYQKLLLAKRAELETNASPCTYVNKQEDQAREDDRPGVVHDEFVLASLSDLTHKQLQAVEQALARMKSGHFGICLQCGEEIAAKRLQAVPWTDSCLGCAEQLDLARQEASIDLRGRGADWTH